jgi:hypothetical protein
MQQKTPQQLIHRRKIEKIGFFEKKKKFKSKLMTLNTINNKIFPIQIIPYIQLKSMYMIMHFIYNK